MRLIGNLMGSVALATAVIVVSPAADVEAAKLAGRNVKIGCQVSLTGKGTEWGDRGEGRHGDRGGRDQRQGRCRRGFRWT